MEPPIQDLVYSLIIIFLGAIVINSRKVNIKFLYLIIAAYIYCVIEAFFYLQMESFVSKEIFQ
jgi:hypothetical protein